MVLWLDASADLLLPGTNTCEVIVAMRTRSQRAPQARDGLLSPATDMPAVLAVAVEVVPLYLALNGVIFV
jgi:hypothetical protein